MMNCERLTHIKKAY